MADLPLIRARGRGAVFSHGEGGRTGIDEFLRDVRSLAASLPERAYVINLCSDRLRFATGLGAALLRNQVTLLPPDITPHLLGELKASYEGLYCLSDDPVEACALETILVGAGQAHAAAQVPEPVPAIRADQTAAVLFTSGSTGRPVAHRKSWGSLVRSALAETEALGLRAFPGITLLGTVPPQHMFGFEATVLLALQGELTVHAGRPFFPADICAELERLPRPRALVSTPVHLRALLEAMKEVPSVDFLLCSTAPLSQALAVQAETRLGAPLHEIYGCTEAGQVALRRTAQTAEWRTVRDIQLRQDEKGTWVRGGHVETDVLLADVVEICGPGRFTLHGRTADLVNIAGKRTSLAYLDYQLNSVQGVRDGAFIVPDEADGAVTRLVAVVVAPGRSAQALMKDLRQRIDPAFLPRPLCVVDAMPRNETGKLSRQALGELIARRGPKAG